MAVEISRSLDEIDNKVKTLNKSLKESNDTTKELDKAMRLDSKNIEVAAQKMSVLQNAVGTATQKLSLLKQKQIEVAEAFKRGDISAGEFHKIELSVLKASNEVKKLNSELSKTKKIKVNEVASSFDELTAKLKKAQLIAQKVSNVASSLLASITAAATAFVLIGDELDDVSKKYSISAEQLQLQRNLYAKSTDDAKNYDRALSSINSVMGSIAKGRGTAYIDTLNKLGVSTTDASGKTKAAAKVYDEIVEALGRLNSETEMASLATVLFGDNGLNVASVAALTREEIAAYNEEMMKAGLVSSDSAEQAGVISDKIDNIKQQMSSASAELMVSLLPTIEALIDFIQSTVVPILNMIANWFANMSPSGQQFVFFILTLIIILPKLIGIVSSIVGVIKAITIASYGAAGGVGAVSAASIPLQPILMAVAAAILVVVLLLSMLSGKSKDVTSELKRQQEAMRSIESQYNDMAADMGGTTELVSHNTNSNIVQHNVNIKAEGDTPISQETADLVADNLADRINASLGGKI